MIADIEQLFRLPVGVPGSGWSDPPPPPAPPRPPIPAGLPPRVMAAMECEFAQMGVEAGSPAAPRDAVQHGAVFPGRQAGQGSVTKTVVEPVHHTAAPQLPPPRLRYEPVQHFSSQQQLPPRGFSGLVYHHHVSNCIIEKVMVRADNLELFWVLIHVRSLLAWSRL